MTWGALVEKSGQAAQVLAEIGAEVEIIDLRSIETKYFKVRKLRKVLNSAICDKTVPNIKISNLRQL